MPNPNHDDKGRFSSGEGGKDASVSDQHRADHEAHVATPLRNAQVAFEKARNWESDLKTHNDFYGIKSSPSLDKATVARERAANRVSDLKTHNDFYGIKD